MANPDAPAGRFNLFSFSGNMRILHLTWIAFFITFVVWFSHAPLMAMIRDQLGLTAAEVTGLMMLNVALAIPARIIVGMMVDKLGPRKVYSTLLVTGGVVCIAFATADDYETLAMLRFLLGFVGAGFVIGIRMIGEWFPAKQVGLAEGIYGGWGNFGSAAAALTLPTVALMFGGDDGWRWAIGSTGVIAMIYGVIYFFSVTDTPKGSTYFKPKKTGAMEITSRGDFFLYCIMSAPLFLALALLTWRLGPGTVGLLSDGVSYLIYGLLAGLYGWQLFQIYRINKDVLFGMAEVEEIHKFEFRQVALLDLCYMVTFGAEIAVVSMLPLYFADTFALSAVMAGALGATFAVMNLIARPLGGYLSDKIGRRISLIISLAGQGLGFFMVAQIDASWALPAAVAVVLVAAFFGKAGNGANYAMVPLIKRRMTGQIAGMVGAYGNVGAVCFLALLTFVSPSYFFMAIGATALVICALVTIFLREPEKAMAEVLPDGTVQFIEVT